MYYELIFKNMKDVTLENCNSATKRLVRAADIVANKIFYFAKNEMRNELKQISNMHVIYLP